MDLDFMKLSAAEDHIEMMLMEMGKLPDFSGDHSYDEEDINHMLNHNNNNNNNNNIVFDNLDVYTNNSPTYPNPHPFNMSAAEPAAQFHQQPGSGGGGRWKTDGFSGGQGQKRSTNMAAMREMIFRIAAMQPVQIDPEAVKPPKRKNVKISTDPQSVAARHRRERISERIRILQRLVPGGTKMDTASMLDEAIHYVKFLKNQVQSLESVAASRPSSAAGVGVGFPVPMTSGSYSGFPVAAARGYHQYSSPANNYYNLQHLTDA